jgi:hypothetical protein
MNQPFLHRSAAPRKRLLAVRLLSALLVAATCLLALGHSAAAAPRQGLFMSCDDVPQTFFSTATAANSSSDYSDLDVDFTNGCPGALVWVTPTFTPGTVWDPHALGVWYNSSSSKWSIFHEDKTGVPLGATYNFYTRPRSYAGNFIQTATTANSGGNWTIIDNPATNNQPAKTLIVTPNWSVGFAYDTHALGVWYFLGHWYLFHEDDTPISPGASYNVLAVQPGATRYFQTATAANSQGDWTVIDSAFLNNQPGADPLVTASFSGGVYDPHVLGVWYQVWTGHWVIFHEDQTPIPLGRPTTSSLISANLPDTSLRSQP